MQRKYIISQATAVVVTAMLVSACSSHKNAPAGQSSIRQDSTSPATLMGKTIVWDYTHASRYEGEYGGPLSLMPKNNDNITTETFTSMRNTGIDPEGNLSTHGVRSGTYLVKSNNKYSGYDYMKTGRNTGTLTIYGWEDATTYSLRFDSATTGTASYKGGGEGMAWKGSGLRFAVK